MILNKKRKKEWAKLLYLKSQLSQKEIAEQVGITEATMSKWVNDPKENWEIQKATFVVTKDQELRRIYQQISALNSAIELRVEGERYPTAKEADTLSKLAKAAQSLERDSSVSEVINVSIALTEYLLDTNPDKAKEFTGILDDFIKHRMSKF